jgi:hypothetical protein
MKYLGLWNGTQVTIPALTDGYGRAISVRASSIEHVYKQLFEEIARCAKNHIMAGTPFPDPQYVGVGVPPNGQLITIPIGIQAILRIHSHMLRGIRDHESGEYRYINLTDLMAVTSLNRSQIERVMDPTKVVQLERLERILRVAFNDIITLEWRI